LLNSHLSTKLFYFLAKSSPLGKTNVFFLVKLLHFNKTFFWGLNHYLFGIAHTQKIPKDIMEGDDDYCR
jgi:hypothetical protein